jgi:LTXXQ motif family protein
MFKLAAIGIAALFVAASPFAYAQDHPAAPQEHPNADEPSALTDFRIETLKSALQLTSSQEKYWPAIEEAIRARAQHRLARLEEFAGRASEWDDSSSVDTALNRNPIDFLHRRADSLAQRAGDLKNLADAWESLYEVLSPDQKRRLAVVKVIAFRGVMNRIGSPHGRFYDEFYDEDEEE